MQAHKCEPARHTNVTTPVKRRLLLKLMNYCKVGETWPSIYSVLSLLSSFSLFQPFLWPPLISLLACLLPPERNYQLPEPGRWRLYEPFLRSAPDGLLDYLSPSHHISAPAFVSLRSRVYLLDQVSASAHFSEQ